MVLWLTRSELLNPQISLRIQLTIFTFGEKYAAQNTVGGNAGRETQKVKEHERRRGKCKYGILAYQRHHQDNRQEEGEDAEDHKHPEIPRHPVGGATDTKVVHRFL